LPDELVVTTDKASNKFFGGEFANATKTLAMERRGSKKNIDTIISINYDELSTTVHMNGKELALLPYDRVVHDAVVSIAVSGEEYINIGSIYKTMTGNPKSEPKQKQIKAINNSLLKARGAWITIDATEEAKAFGFDKFKYEGALIPHERITATVNGKSAECIHILRTPPLYDYANRKNQIARIDTKLLNTPINKNEEAIVLQSYLYRRILAMTGSSKLSKNILYDTVYKEIGISAQSDGALRNKKSKVRDTIKTILDYWEAKSFISGYVENKKGREFYSVSIEIPASKQVIDIPRRAGKKKVS